MKNKILEVLSETPRKGWSRKIAKTSDFISWLNLIYPNIHISEQLILLYNDQSNPPNCPVCSNRIKLTGVIYKNTCSRICAEQLKKQTGQKAKEMEKAKQTNIKKYGETSPAKTRQFQEKRLKTMINKYGDVISPKHKEILELSKSKAYLTRKNNLLENHGVENISSLIETKENRKNTYLIKYGVEHYHQSSEYKEKIKNRKIDKIETLNSDIIVISFDNITNYKTMGITYTCKKCLIQETIPMVTFNYRSINFNTPCSNCGNFNKPWSNGEKELLSNIREFYKGEIITNKKIIPPYTLDMFIPEFNLAIEYNGLFWHSERGGGKSPNYHKIKTDLCRSKNIRLLHIFENEYKNSKEIILEKIKNIVGLSDKGVGARKIIIKEISSIDGNIFLNKFHIQGGVPGSKFLGGFNNDQLISVLAYKKVSNILDITRYANDFKIYPGLFSKFLSYINKSIEYDRIITFADLRYSYGNLYQKTGFDIEYEINSGYYYTDYINFYHKFNFRKENIRKKFNIDISNRTEKELMEELGFDRIWDAGKIKFTKIN